MGSTASLPKKTAEKTSEVIADLKTSADVNSPSSKANDCDNDGDFLPEMLEVDKEKFLAESIASELEELYEMNEPWKTGKKAFDMLFKKYFSQKKRRNLIANLMIVHNLLDVCVRIWDFCHVPEDNQFFYLRSKLYQRMKIVLQNFLNVSVEFAQHAYKQREFMKRIMKDFSNPELNVSNLNEKKKRTDIKLSLGILHNIVRHCNQSKLLIREENGIELLHNYYPTKFLIIKAHVMILLAYCINEKENEKIVTETGVIKFIVRLLGNAVHTKNHVARPSCFSATELIEGLDKLAFNDDNKRSIVNAGVLPLVNVMLGDNFSVDEHKAACHCLWTLSFQPDNKEKILKEISLIESVHRIKDLSGDQSTVRSCDGVLFVIEGKEQERSALISERKHIMISYQWEVQDIVIKISDKLKSHGFSVWIDVDQMAQGSILSSMADAVEKSSLLLIAVTEEYKNSNSCRTEAEYAYKLSKPIFPLLLEENYVPDGWLGAFVGVQFYIKITNRDFLNDAKFDDLILKLENKMTSMSCGFDDINISVTDNGSRVDHSSSTAHVPQSVVSPSLPCIAWTKEQTRDWLMDQVNADEDLLPDFDGAALYQMFKLLQRSPDIYYRSLRDDFRLKWIDLFHLTDALELLCVVTTTFAILQKSCRAISDTLFGLDRERKQIRLAGPDAGKITNYLITAPTRW